MGLLLQPIIHLFSPHSLTLTHSLSALVGLGKPCCGMRTQNGRTERARDALAPLCCAWRPKKRLRAADDDEGSFFLFHLSRPDCYVLLHLSTALSSARREQESARTRRKRRLKASTLTAFEAAAAAAFAAAAALGDAARQATLGIEHSNFSSLSLSLEDVDDEDTRACAPSPRVRAHARRRRRHRRRRRLRRGCRGAASRSERLSRK